MIIARVIGIVLSVLSAIVLAIMVNALRGAQKGLARHGITDPVSLDPKSRSIILAWAMALLIGLGLIFWSYSR